MRLGDIIGGKITDESGRKYYVREVKYAGHIVWPKYSLALSTDMLRFSAAGGSTTLYVAAVASNERGTQIRRIPLSESDLQITKYGDSENRINRQGLVFTADDLGTTPYDEATGYYLITWPEKGVSIQLPFIQALNKIERTIPAHTITTGLGALEFSPAIAPVLGGEVSVTCVRTYTLVDAEYIWSSGANQGGEEHSGLLETTRPQSLECSPQPVYIGSDYVTIDTNAHCTDQQYYSVKAVYDGVKSSAYTLEQAADSYTEVEVPVADSYFAHISIFDSPSLTAKGGSCTLTAEAGHYARTEYRWASGGSTFGDRYLVTDDYSITKSGDSSYFHISGLNVTHDNMAKRTRDAIVFIVINLGDNTTQTQTDEIAIDNHRSLVREEYTEVTEFDNIVLTSSSISGGVLSVNGGIVEVTGTLRGTHHAASYEWDSGVPEGGETTPVIQTGAVPERVLCAGVQYISGNIITFGDNQHNESQKSYQIMAFGDYRKGVSGTVYLTQAADHKASVPIDSDYHAMLWFRNSPNITAVGGECLLVIESWHQRTYQYIWESGASPTYSGTYETVYDSNYTLEKFGDTGRYIIHDTDNAYVKKLEHLNMEKRGQDSIQFKLTNHDANYTTDALVITNSSRFETKDVYSLASLASGLGSAAESITIHAESKIISGRVWDSQYPDSDTSIQNVLSQLSVNIGTLSASDVSGSLDVILNAPANTSLDPREIIVMMTRDGDVKATKTFVQDGRQRTLDSYVDIAESATSSSRTTRIQNNYSKRMFISLTLLTVDNDTQEVLLQQPWGGTVEANSEAAGPSSSYGYGTSIQFTVIEARLI